jgi:hypothetical protein
MVRIKKAIAMGLLKKMSRLPPEIVKERRSPRSSMGASTNAMRNGIGDISKSVITYPNIPNASIVKTSKRLLLIE